MNNNVDLNTEFTDAISNVNPGDKSIILNLSKEKMIALFGDKLNENEIESLPDTYPLEIKLTDIIKMVKDISEDTIRDILIQIQEEM